jgi:hypothetical protein
VGVNVMVDPQWRGKGVAGPLLGAVRAGSRVSCALGLSPQGYRHPRRHDASSMGTVPVWVHLIDAREVARGAAASRPWRRLGAPFARVMGPVGGLMSRMRSVGAEPVAIDAFDDRADAIWCAAAAAYPVIGRRRQRRRRVTTEGAVSCT